MTDNKDYEDAHDFGLAEAISGTGGKNSLRAMPAHIIALLEGQELEGQRIWSMEAAPVTFSVELEGPKNRYIIYRTSKAGIEIPEGALVFPLPVTQEELDKAHVEDTPEGRDEVRVLRGDGEVACEARHTGYTGLPIRSVIRSFGRGPSAWARTCYVQEMPDGRFCACLGSPEGATRIVGTLDNYEEAATVAYAGMWAQWFEEYKTLLDMSKGVIKHHPFETPEGLLGSEQ